MRLSNLYLILGILLLVLVAPFSADSAWQIKDMPNCTSIDLDSLNRPHLSCDQKYLYHDGNEWIEEGISVNGGRIKLDSLDRPHIVTEQSSDFAYMYKDGESWHIEPSIGIA